MENKMDKRNLYKTGRIIAENAFCSIVSFSENEGHGGHYKIDKVIYPDRRIVYFGGNLSIPAHEMDTLTF